MSVSLRSLSDRELLSRTSRLTGRERAVTLLVLLHLNEIERRRLHLKEGFSSMYVYCTDGLGYSHSAANRRIRSARCVANFPEVFAMLQANEVNLSTVAQVSHVLTSSNKSTLLGKIRGKSQREVEAIVAACDPRGTTPRDRVRSVVVRVPVAAASTPLPDVTPVAATSAPAAPEPEVAQDRNGREPEDPVSGTANTIALQFEKRSRVEFCANEAFMALYEKLRSLMWHKLPVNPSIEQVLTLALEYVIAREDPEKRQERTPGMKTTEQHPSSHPRRIPARVRDAVFVRDQGRCSYVGPTGRRCESTQALQVDHVVPVARGGPGTVGNLRLLCAYHNRIEAERVLGKAWGDAAQDRYGRGAAPDAASTTDSSPRPRTRGSCRGRPFPARP